MGLGQYNRIGEYCGPHTASSVFLKIYNNIFIKKRYKDFTLFLQVPGDCVCKANVTGSKCERCKVGFYELDASKPSGCTGRSAFLKRLKSQLKILKILNSS